MLVFWDRTATPTDETATGKADILVRDFAFEAPVLIDVLTGAIYEIPQASILPNGSLTIFSDIPCADTPFVLADKKVFETK